MHFTIPSAEQQQDSGGAKYVVYALYADGKRHCSVRYRQLSCLHQQLRQAFGAKQLPSFPPKRLLPLQPEDVEWRRQQLERYFQLLAQNSLMIGSEIFNGFLVMAQLETQKLAAAEVSLDVFLLNGVRVSLSVTSCLQTDDVLERLCAQLKLPPRFTYYFGLFVTRRRTPADPPLLVRRLGDFEAPYLSLRTAGDDEDGGDRRLTLLKTCWDSGYDDQLCDDPAALNLFYVQRVAEVEWAWIAADADSRQQLALLQAKGHKLEYVRLTQTLPYCGYVQFDTCVCDAPEPSTPVRVSIGCKELSVRPLTAPVVVSPSSPTPAAVTSYKVTRMRCWRISSVTAAGVDPKQDARPPQLELSFQYLMARDRLRWVSVRSSQAALMSMCLQSMVEELMRRRRGLGVPQPGDKVQRVTFSYLSRDGALHQVSGRASGAAEPPHHTRPVSFRTLSSKFSQLNVLSKATSDSTTSHRAIENRAFDEIGDDEL